jgi:hypothetical protein
MKQPLANFILFSGLILFPIIFFGQTPVLNLPKKYTSPTSVIEAPKPDDVLSQQLWFVWSDRSNNPVYLNSVGSEKVAELEFGAACAVLQVEGDRLLIANLQDVRHRLLNAEAKAIGWIDFNNLVLWSECLKAGPCKLNKQALVFNADDSDSLTQIDIPPKFLNGPDHSYEAINDAGRNLVRKHFVFKESADFLLLGRSFFLEKTNDFDEALVGWIPKKNCLIWDSNIALEVNWEQEAVAERDSIDNRVIIWENEADAATFNTNAKHLCFESPFYSERSNRFNNRFFILEQQDYQLDSDNKRPLKVGFLCEEVKDNGKEYFDNKTWSDFSEGLRKIRKINLIFVINASIGMVNYSSAISIAIQSAMRMIEDESRERGWGYHGNHFKFGVLLFRDESEERILQKYGYSLTDDIRNLSHWIESNMNPEHSMFDRDYPEALYYGISEAIDSYDPDPRETNYMIVVGAAGDHQNPDKVRTFISEDEVIARLVEYNMNVMAYQVHRREMPSIENPFQDFEDQLKRIMIKSAEKMTFEANGDIYFEKSGKNSFKLNHKSPVTGEIIISPSGSRMSSEQLEGHLINAIQVIDRRTTNKHQEITDILEREGVKHSYHEGYTFLQPESADHPWFKYVLLIEHREIDQLINTLRDLSIAIDYTANVLRDRLMRAVEQILHVYYGNSSRDEIYQITFGDLFFCITGQKGNSKFSNLRISDLADQRIISNADIRELVDRFQETLKALEEIHNLNRNYPHLIHPGSNEVYYWVPTNIFPHD